MKVRVKPLSPAGDVLGGFVSFGEAELDMVAGSTVADIKDQIELSKEEPYASLVDGQHIVPDDRAGHALSDGDEITLLPAIQGGLSH